MRGTTRFDLLPRVSLAACSQLYIRKGEVNMEVKLWFSMPNVGKTVAKC